MSATAVTAFAPASVANLAVGFDILGHTLDGPGDKVTVRRIAEPVIRISDIRGIVPGLPRDPSLNTAGCALLSLRDRLGLPYGYEIAIDKGIPLGSGLGGSAASAVAALVAANALLDAPLPREALYEPALDGEARSAGARHGDNVGAQLLGGLVLATPGRLTAVPVPPGLIAAVVHPHLVLETRRAREALERPFRLVDIVAQSGRLALVLAGCHRGDLTLIREGLEDVLIEPHRAPLIPGFAAVKRAALAAGALGAGIAGAGPSVFAWFDSRAAAERAGEAMRAAFADAGLESDAVLSPVAGPRAEVVR